ncbi:MAG: cell division protein ZapA [Epsilonproteobacteria bacterium]|nr:cell division protein ZapA [Campylobacterota bacterium]
MRKKIKISLLGKSYSIVTDQEAETIERAARLVEKMIKEKMEKMVLPDTEKIALVVALELATDLELSNQKLDAWENKLERLSATIDKNFSV